MARKLFLLYLSVILSLNALATGEPSTYFQIFVPPNNDAVRRDAALIITAIYDSTAFEIIDDGMDGDTDDSKKGILMAGQSYVLYIRDNGINDDARYASGGVLKWDGDYFIVKSDKLLYASQSTNSDWQHDWVPSTDKKSIGQKFIVYSPPFTSSRRDLNVFTYSANTTVTLQKISWQPKTNTGFTDVNLETAKTVFTRTLNVGEDIIYKYPDGRDVMEAGETYMILSDKPITVQYGALFGNERDGGGYVPSSNGSSSGDLLYFGVPYQAAGEQEIRIVSWDDANTVLLERFVNGTWMQVKSFSLNKMQAGDWVGKSNGNVSYSTVFRVTCSAGKKVSVFEGNWFETGSPGTSDMGTMVSAENGTSSGKKFLTYMAPPGNEQNVRNPFTGTNFGQQLTHLYLFAKDGAKVTVKDAYTNGQKLNRTYTIDSARYADCFLTLAEWQRIYNNTGTPSGPERPYLLVESDRPISVMNTNFNDNWMCYVGSSLGQSFTQTSTVSQEIVIPADTIVVKSVINTGSGVDQPKIEVVVQDGLKVIESNLITPSEKVGGDIKTLSNKTIITFDSLPPLKEQTQYTVETEVVAAVGSNNGNLLTGSANTSVETVVTGTVAQQIQQSSTAQVVNINTANTSQLIFSRYNDNLISKDSTDSWTASWVDINNDGYDDLFVTDRRSNRPNLIYMNLKNGSFGRGQSLIADTAVSMTHSWADVDNDGDADLLVMNNTRRPNTFYRNNNGTLTRENTQSFTQTVSYYHGGSFADYDNDGNVDLFLCNYFPTKYNELHRNGGATGFVRETASVIPAEANQSVGATWADYDSDGFIDLFVPNGNGFKNSLFHNEGNGSFRKENNVINNEGGQSVGSCWGDYDNDGDLDLFVTNSNATGNFLYRNEGKGNFSRITQGNIVTDKGNSHGCSFADMDNDGDLDLYVSNDRGFKFLYLNNGKGEFTKKDDEVISYNFGLSLGHAWSDFDRDGDLDLIAATHSNTPNALFTNNGNNNAWINIHLNGKVSNASAIGADVFVLANGQWQMREVNSQSGFGGQSSFNQHFGLGNASVIDSIKVKWPSGVVQVLTKVATKQFLDITEEESIKLNGAVFIDANGNGKKEDDEIAAGRAIVTFMNEQTRIHCNNSGNFSVFLKEGIHRFQVADGQGLKGSGYPVIEKKIDRTYSDKDTVWLPASVVCEGVDLNVIMGSTAIRKGFTNNQMTLLVTNAGRKEMANPVLKFKAPATLLPATANIPADITESVTEGTQSFRVYTWKLNPLAAFESRLIQFLHGNSTSVSIGDTMPLTAWVETSGADCTPADNSMQQTYKVVGAIDPNDISVSPQGVGPEGFIPAKQTLTYTIRFQNLGNHPASSVEITDALPLGLDLSTVKIAATSHDGLQVQQKGQTLTFKWNDIYLPDSTSDEAGSNGYVIFTVQPVKGIQPGTVLRNKASIRFDHYEALETNEVINTILSARQEQSMVEVKTYPNPASDVILVSLHDKLGKLTNRIIARIELTDLNGRVLLTKYTQDPNDVRINIPEWMNGFYLLKVTDTKNSIYTRKVWIQKPGK